ncbi:MAG: hypothetical protein D6743_15180 [Calditrichaeota bacterium]|nr:MAG: hypothetical protein D6743_15180 [Calditrichota bacterium]
MSEQNNALSWNRLWGALILVAGVLLLLQNLELLPWEIWGFVGPVFLIVWGVLVLRNPGAGVCCCCGFRHRDVAQEQ